MAKFSFPKYKETVDAENAEYDRMFEGRDAEIKSSSALIINGDLSVGGSHQLVETEAKKNWLAQVRKAHKNDFIGKSYMMRAPEFERDDEEVTKSEYMSDEQAAEILVEDKGNPGEKHIDDEYNPNITETEVTDHDEISRRFVEACIIDNTTARCIGWEFEDILSECASALENEFPDDYELPADFDDLVEASLEKAEGMQKLGYDIGPKVALPKFSDKKDEK